MTEKHQGIEQRRNKPEGSRGRSDHSEHKIGHWANIARQWNQVGPPLRPSPQDISFAARAVAAWVNEHGIPRSLILGVTPELYHLPWPKGTDVIAVDNNQEMINQVWPGPRNAAIRANWVNIPLQSRSRDIVLCDGGIHLLAHPHDHMKLVQTLHGLLVPGGLCIFRLFVPPAQQETSDAVLQDLLAGKIPNLNILKLRLCMSLLENATKGVELRQVWETLHNVAPDFARLAERIAWPLDHLHAINTYRDSTSRYFFIGIDDIRRMFCEEHNGFEFDSTHEPTYELGERCPTVILRRRP